MAQPVGPKEIFPVGKSSAPPQSNAYSSVPKERELYMPQGTGSPLVGRATCSTSLPDSRTRYRRGKEPRPGASAEIVEIGFEIKTEGQPK